MNPAFSKKRQLSEPPEGLRRSTRRKPSALGSMPDGEATASLLSRIPQELRDMIWGWLFEDYLSGRALARAHYKGIRSATATLQED